MTWLDFACFAAFAIFMSLAFKRGVVLELADLACLLLGGILSFRLFRPLANGLHSSIFSGWSLGFLEKFCLFTVFICTCLVVFSVGLTFQRRAKEEKLLDADVDQKLGLVVGFFKSVILIVLSIGLMFQNEIFPAREHNELRNGPVVSALIGLGGAVSPLVYIAAPADLAKGFMTKGLGRKSSPSSDSK